MKILNYRKGFAANSSSTHSTFFVEDPKEVYEKIYDTLNFGWEPFVLKSRSLIDRYIAAQIIGYIDNDISDVMKLNFIKECIPSIDITIDDLDSLGVDHQSQWLIPYDYHCCSKVFPSIEFIKDLVTYLHSDQTVIVGGNDNDDFNERPLRFDYTTQKEAKAMNRISHSSCDKDYICIKDQKYNYWILINQETGERITLTFDDNSAPYTRSSFPQLVDLIISDQCYCNCNYCYRNCTPNGKIAPINTIYHYLESLYNLGTMEVALGGGDLLKYPYLDDLLNLVKEFRKKNMIINTTIRVNTDNNEKPIQDYIIQKFMKTFNGVAFSIDKHYQLNAIKKYLNERSSIQIIPELGAGYFHSAIIDEIKKSNLKTVTLLGFKQTGRGDYNEFKKIYERTINDNRQKFNGWISLYTHCCINLNVDTQLIKNIPEIKSSLKEWMYTENEGTFTCCINAVNNTMMKSSYCNDILIPKLDHNNYWNGSLGEDIQRTFESWTI